MSLLFNLSFLNQQPTGLATYALNILPYLRDFSPSLASSHPIPGFHCLPIPPKMSTDYGLIGHLRRLWWTQWHLPKCYQQQNSSLLFTPIPEAPLYQDCRYVVTIHDLIPLRFFHGSSRLSMYFRFVVPQIISQAVHVFCNSLSTANEIMTFFATPAEKITPIYLAFDPTRFYFLDLPSQNYFLYIGRHDHYKNLSRLLTAFAQLEGNYELWIGGAFDRRYTPALQAQVRQLQIQDKVKFLGYIPQSEITTVINQAIAVVFPSLWEGFGLPVIEAMACGTPVITSNISALLEIANSAALLIDPYSVLAIKEAMQKVADSELLRQELRQAGLQRSQTFIWQTTGEATASVLRSFL